MSDYKTILSDQGYLQIKGCSCGGVRHDKYRNKDLTVYVRPVKLTFRLKRNNNYITSSQPIKYLNEALATATVGLN